MPECVVCGRLKEICARYMCKTCYYKDIYRDKHLNSPLIKCACGCNKMIHSINEYGDEVIYEKYHHLKGEDNPRYHGYRISDKDGYTLIFKPTHPNSRKSGYMLEHRFVMSRHLYRPLKRNELVHHIDENKGNNDISNLKLMNGKEHQRHHIAVDMSNRLCLICNQKTDMSKNGYYVWFKHNNGFICLKCYKKKRSRKHSHLFSLSN